MLFFNWFSFVSDAAAMGDRLPWLKDSFIGTTVPKVANPSRPVRPFFKVGRQRKNDLDMEIIKTLLTSEKDEELATTKRAILNPRQWNQVLPLLPK